VVAVRGLLGCFAEMHRRLGSGFNPYLPTESVSRLGGFIDGYSVAAVCLGATDKRGEEFFVWLRDVKGAFPTEGWEEKLLEDSGGDEAKALRTFFGLVEEFLAQVPPEP
jgi:hypothetical protein